MTKKRLKPNKDNQGLSINLTGEVADCLAFIASELGVSKAIVVDFVLRHNLIDSIADLRKEIISV